MSKSEVAAVTPRAIGQAVPRREDATILAGRSEYIADIRLPRMLHAVFVRSPFAHARITNVDVSAARELPGVELVWTGADVHARAPGIPSAQKVDGFVETVQPAIAHDEVRYVGEAVAVIVAQSRCIAEDALELVDVDYDELDAVADIGAAKTGSALANDAVPGNVIHHYVRVKDDLDDVFADAAVTVSDVFYNNRVNASPMETRGCVARHDWTSGAITFWSATQMPGFLRTMLASLLQIPEHTIEVVTPHVGGGFGQKAHIHPEELVVCLLARELNEPVSWIEDRQENLLAATHAKHQINTMTLAVDADGVFVGIRNHSETDSGAYNCLPWTSAIESQVGTSTIAGAYKFPRADADCVNYATNKTPIGAYRGVGWTASQIARECLIDRAARELGLSPFEIRRRNVVQPEDFPYTNVTGLEIREGTFRATVDRLEEMVDYDAFRARQLAARDDGRYLGVGISIFNELTGIGTRSLDHLGTPVTTHDTSTVRLDPTGTVTVTTSFVTAGQGLPTTLAQVAADAFGVPLEKVVVRTGSTGNTYGLGTFASRAAVIGAGSIGRAAEIVRAKVRQMAGHLLEAAPDDIVLADDRVHVAGVPSRGMALAEVAGAIYFAAQTHPEDFDPTLEATATFDPGDHILANGGHAVVVEVDVETGLVRVERVFCVEDCGRMINPMVVEGQIRGGIVQGIGSALFEELVHDVNGQLVTTTFQDYLLPSAWDVPDIEIAHLETPSSIVPGGIKGMGESAMISTPAAVICAVNDALAPLGASVTRYPASPERVFQALRAASGAGQE